jgi:hypothetical protein
LRCFGDRRGQLLLDGPGRDFSAMLIFSPLFVNLP